MVTGRESSQWFIVGHDYSNPNYEKILFQNVPMSRRSFIIISISKRPLRKGLFYFSSMLKNSIVSGFTY
jgi:hypothetical protein